MRRMAIGILFLVGVLLAPLFAHAAELSVEPNTDHEGAGFSVDIVLQFDEAVNALEGVLTYDDSLVRAARIHESPSGVPLWVSAPAVTDDGLVFAGIFPGGIEPRLTDRITVMTVIFEVLQAGTTELGLGSVRVLKHSAIPTDDDVRTFPLTVRADASDIGPVSDADDEMPPLSFRIMVPADSGLYDDRHVAVFRTRDLDGTVERYELRERVFGLFGTYRSVSSPAVLSPLWRWSIIEVRATDGSGNVVSARHIPITLVATYVLMSVFVGWGVRRSLRTRT